jgi:hypothetical protein
MARTLLEIVKSPENIPAMTTEEFAYALLEDMQQRLHDRIRGMANRNSVAESVISVANYQLPEPRATHGSLCLAGRGATLQGVIPRSGIGKCSESVSAE